MPRLYVQVLAGSMGAWQAETLNPMTAISRDGVRLRRFEKEISGGWQQPPDSFLPVCKPESF